MQAENEALQQLVLEVAQNKQEAQRRVATLKQKYGNLLAKVTPTSVRHLEQFAISVLTALHQRFQLLGREAVAHMH